MEISRLNPTHIEELTELWGECFVIPYEQASLWVDEKSIRNCIGAFEKGRLVSVLSISSFESYIRGKVLPLSGIGGVATLPEYRGKKYVHDLLSEAIKISKEKGMVFSALYPFSFGFYRNFGWELAGFRRRYKIETDNLPKFPEVENVKKISLADWKTVKNIYEKFACQFTGPLKRTEERWESVIFGTKDLTYLYVWEDKEREGYVLYTIERTPVNRIVVKEMISLSTSAYKGLLGLFSRQSMSIQEVEWTTPLEDDLNFILPNPRVNCQIEPTFMLRIIDLEKAIKKLPFPMEVKEKIKIKVIDPNANWNDGIWKLEIKDGKGNIEKSEDWDISLNITTLCQIISGILSPQKAYKLKTIDVKNTESLEKLERIFPTYPTFCWDYF